MAGLLLGDYPQVLLYKGLNTPLHIIENLSRVLKYIIIKYMIIGIDARFYGPANRGIGRYAQEIIDRIIIADQQNDFVVFLSPQNFDLFATSRPNTRKVLITTRWYSLAEQFILPLIMWREKVDLAFIPHFNVPLWLPCPFVATVHDLILNHFPDRRASTLNPLLYKLKMAGYHLIIRNTLKKARSIIAVSQWTRDDILKCYPKIDARKIFVTYEGVSVDNQNKKILYNNKRRIVPKTPFLLYVGSAYPHKNLEKLILAYKKIRAKRKGIKLVLAGGDDYFYKRMQKFADAELSDEARADVVFAGFVSDVDLDCLYRSALGYVFPSLYEGFGLPPLEAMARGCPVVSSNVASLPEVLEDAALYFNPQSVDDMALALERLIADDRLRRDLRAKGLKQIKKYSWDDCARQTAEILAKARA